MTEITYESISAKLKGFIINESGNGGDAKIDEDTTVLKQGIVDSLMIMSIMAFCEKEFGCSFGPEEVEEQDFQSVRALATRVYAKVHTPCPVQVAAD